MRGAEKSTSIEDSEADKFVIFLLKTTCLRAPRETFRQGGGEELSP